MSEQNLPPIIEEKNPNEVLALGVFIDPTNPNYMRIEGKGEEMQMLGTLSAAAERIRYQGFCKTFIGQLEASRAVAEASPTPPPAAPSNLIVLPQQP
jgi:hypothetical protein